MSYDPKPWFFKAGRLNMISGEPVGFFARCPLVECWLSIYGWTDVRLIVRRVVEGRLAA